MGDADGSEQRIVDGRAWSDFCDALKAAGAVVARRCRARGPAHRGGHVAILRRPHPAHGDQMSLPNEVEKAEALADQLYQQAYGQGSAPEGGQPARATTPPAPAPAAPAPDAWEQKYRVLAGKYNAEVPTLSRENKELKGQVATLSQQVSEINAKLAQAEANAKRQPLVKPEEVQEFGEPLVDLIRRAAREEAQALAPQGNGDVSRLESELKSIKDKKDLVVIENDQERIRNLMARGVLCVEGRATRDSVLREAGIERAKGLVSSLDTDAE